MIGRLVDVGLARESSRGTGVVPAYYLPRTVFTVEDKVTKVNERSSYGNIGYEGNDAPVALKWAEGDIELPLFDRSFGLFLYALLGSLSTSGPSDSLYTHTFSLAQNSQHQSLTIAVKEQGLSTSMLFQLAMIEKLEINIVPDEIVTCRVTFMSKRSKDYSFSNASVIAENKFIGRHLTFKLASLTSGLTAASNIPLKKLTLRFEKRLKTDFVLGTVDPEDILNQAFSIEGDLELNLEDKTYRALMLDGSYRAVRIDLTNTDALIGVSSRPQFTLDLSRVHFDAWESDRPNDEISMQKLTFKALYDITNGNIINSCTLKNAASSY